MTNSSLLVQVASLARRSTLRTLRQPAVLVSAILFPLMFYAINAYGLDAATSIPGFPADSYKDFAFAFPLVQASLFGAITAGSDLARDIESGFFDRLSLTPMRPSALLLGMLAGVVALGLIQGVIFLIVGVLFGVDIKSGLPGIFVLILLTVLVSLGFGGIGAMLALRTGSVEAVESAFPLFFVSIFMSSINLPRNLIEADWFRYVATANPISYLVEGIRSLVITGWDVQALTIGFGCALAIVVLSIAGGVVFPSDEGGALMVGTGGSFFSVAWAVAARQVYKYFANPAFLAPAFFPIFFFIAFAGGLTRVGDVPGFDYAAGYVAFQFVWALLQAVAMGGAFTGFSIAGDFENGFARRLMLAAPDRRGIILGYTLASLVRAAMTGALTTVVALIAGMRILGGFDFFGLIGLAILVNVAATLFGAGIAMLLRTQQAGPVIRTPIFLVLFLAPVFVPLNLLSGWIETLARLNPFTTILDAARGYLAGTPVSVLPAFSIGIGLVVAFALWALYGLRRAEKTG